MLEIRNTPQTPRHSQGLRTALPCPDPDRPTPTMDRPRATQKKRTMVAPMATHFHYRRCGGHPLGGWGLRRYICIDINIQCVMFFGTGEAGRKFFLVFFFGLYTLGEEIGYSKGRGWGMGEMLQGISPIPPF